MKKILLISLITFLYKPASSQKTDKLPRYFGSPISIDSSNILIIPTLYNSSLTSLSKVGIGSNYYSNILFTPFRNGESIKLFTKDTYIKPISNNVSFRYSKQHPSIYISTSSISNNWIFLMVKNYDLNKNDEIDSHDPTILYCTDLYGNGLKKITNEFESVDSYFVYENKNIIILKIQRDLNKDDKFTNQDNDYYYLFLDHQTLNEVKRIEINSSKE